MLHHTIHGAHHPNTVVLLHGYLSDSTYWTTLIPRLQTSHRVVVIDLLGFGQSRKPKDSSYSLDEHTQAVQSTLAALQLTRFTLVGHSMGGLIASNLSQKLPHAVEKLVLFNMPVFTSQPQARQTLSGTSKLYRSMLYTSAGRIGWPVLKKLAANGLVRKTAPRTLRPVIQSTATNTHQSRKNSLLNTIEATNAIALLQAIPVPTQLIQGTYDRTIYRQNLTDSSLPAHITLEWVESGHHTPVKLPEVSYHVITSQAEYGGATSSSGLMRTA